RNLVEELELKSNDLVCDLGSNDGTLLKGFKSCGVNIYGVEPTDVAEVCMDAISEERFMILPHRQVQGYTEFKAENPEKWLSGMRKFQDRLFIDEPLPGDLMQDFR
ncbi:MAG: hypothetical protein VXV73_05705, partial [Actinomycetota bacterium]|nr:hypothetical protein [Actinomycetota bacterium]